MGIVHLRKGVLQRAIVRISEGYNPFPEHDLDQAFASLEKAFDLDAGHVINMGLETPMFDPSVLRPALPRAAAPPSAYHRMVPRVETM